MITTPDPAMLADAIDRMRSQTHWLRRRSIFTPVKTMTVSHMETILAHTDARLAQRLDAAGAAIAMVTLEHDIARYKFEALADVVDDLAALVRRLARPLRQAAPGSALSAQVLLTMPT